MLQLGLLGPTSRCSVAFSETRYSFVLVGSHGPDQMREAIDALRADRTLYVLTMQGRVSGADAIVRYIEENYEPIAKRRDSGPLIWRRRLE